MIMFGIVVVVLLLAIVTIVLSGQRLMASPAALIKEWETPVGTVLEIPQIDTFDVRFEDEKKYSYTTFHAPKARVSKLANNLTVVTAYVSFPRELKPYVYVFGAQREGWFHGDDTWSELIPTSQEIEWNNSLSKWSVNINLSDTNEGPNVKFITASTRKDLSNLRMRVNEGEVELRGDQQVLVHLPKGMVQYSPLMLQPYFGSNFILELFPPVTKAVFIKTHNVSTSELGNTAFQVLTLERTGAESTESQLKLTGEVNTSVVSRGWGIVAHDNHGRLIPSTQIDINEDDGSFNGSVSFGATGCRYLRLASNSYDITFDVDQARQTYTVRGSDCDNNDDNCRETSYARKVSGYNCQDSDRSGTLDMFNDVNVCQEACKKDNRCNFCSRSDYISLIHPWATMRSCKFERSEYDYDYVMDNRREIIATRLTQKPNTYVDRFKEAICFSPPLGATKCRIAWEAPPVVGFQSIELSEDGTTLNFETVTHIYHVEIFDSNGNHIINTDLITAERIGYKLKGTIYLSKLGLTSIKLLLAHDVKALNDTSCRLKLGINTELEHNPPYWIPIVIRDGDVCVKNIPTSEGDNFPYVLEFTPQLGIGVDQLQQTQLPNNTFINELTIADKSLTVQTYSYGGYLSLFDGTGAVVISYLIQPIDKDPISVRLPDVKSAEVKWLRYILFSAKPPLSLQKSASGDVVSVNWSH